MHVRDGSLLLPRCHPSFDRPPGSCRLSRSAIALEPVNARPRLRATDASAVHGSRSREVLGDVVRPVINGKLAAEGLPLWRCGAGVLLPVIESDLGRVTLIVIPQGGPCQSASVSASASASTSATASPDCAAAPIPAVVRRRPANASRKPADCPPAEARQLPFRPESAA